MSVDFEGYDPDPDRFDPRAEIGFDVDAILSVAATSRPGSTATFCLDAGPIPYRDKHFAWWPVQYDDGERIIVKTPILSSDDPKGTEALIFLRREAKILVFLESHKFTWSPRLVYWTDSFNTALAQPYMIHTMPRGKRLAWTNASPAEKGNRAKVLDQIAHITFELAALRPYASRVRTPLDWLHQQIDNNIMDFLKSTQLKTALGVRDWINLRFLARRLTEGRDNVNQQVMAHNTLYGGNIFVDDNFNVTGFVGWEGACHMPVRFAFRFPELLSILKKWIPYAPQHQADFAEMLLIVPPAMKADREIFISRMQFYFVTRADHRQIGHLSPESWEMMCWDHELVDWNHLILRAVMDWRFHEELAERDYLVSRLPDARWGYFEETVDSGSVYRETVEFYLDHQEDMNPWLMDNEHGRLTNYLLQRAIQDGLDWEMVEHMLRDAFGVSPPCA